MENKIDYDPEFHGWDSWKKSCENMIDFLIERLEEIKEHKQVSKETPNGTWNDLMFDLFSKSVKLQYTENAIYENNANFEILIRFQDKHYQNKPLETRVASMLDDLLIFLNSKEQDFIAIAQSFDEGD